MYDYVHLHEFVQSMYDHVHLHGYVQSKYDFVHLHGCVQSMYDFVTFCHLITQSNNTPQFWDKDNQNYLQL